MQNKMYRIRHKQTGKFAKAGTSRDRWGTEGKWFTARTLRLHLSQFNHSSFDYPYGDDVAEIVKYDLTESKEPFCSPSHF